MLQKYILCVLVEKKRLVVWCTACIGKVLGAWREHDHQNQWVSVREGKLGCVAGGWSGCWISDLWRNALCEGHDAVGQRLARVLDPSAYPRLEVLATLLVEMWTFACVAERLARLVVELVSVQSGTE